MAETKSTTPVPEREYTIPLRRAYLMVPQYRRTGKAIKAIKIFIAKHMKVPNRDVNNVKLDVYLNNELWFRGRTSPPSKVRVKASKVGDIVHVTFVETPQHVKFLQAKNERMHKKVAKKDEKKEEETKAAPQKTEEQKQDEKEKEKAVADQAIKQANAAAKTEKHVTPVKQPKIQRMALRK